MYTSNPRTRAKSSIPTIPMTAAVIAAAAALAIASPRSAVAVPATDQPAATAGHGATGAAGAIPAYGGSGEPTIVAAVANPSPLAIGTTSAMVLSLKTKDGKPVTLAELEVVHTEAIHLLIVDPSLGDYHHIHPKPAAAPGTYSFDFAPRRSGVYNVYADLHPKATGIQEYTLATVTVPGAAQPVKRTDNRTATVDGYRFDVSLDDPALVQGKATMARVKIAGPDGKPFAGLEPVMGAFAHMVGFSEDRMNVAHIHPLGKEPEKASERGGPEMQFHVSLARAGYHVLYVQVLIDGKDRFAPFGVDVAERKAPTDAASLMREVDDAVEKLGNVAVSGPMHKVHGLAFEARDLMAGLPASTPPLADDKKAKLAVSLKRVAAMAGLLDKHGDAKDAAQVQALMPRFDAEVAAIHELLGTTPKAKAAGTAGAKPVGNSKCPVSGMAVGSMEAGAALVHDGWKVGLCCNGCTEKFKADAAAMLAKAKADAAK